MFLAYIKMHLKQIKMFALSLLRPELSHVSSVSNCAQIY